MVSCHKTYDCMVMTETDRDNILSSGPARFQLLTAYHPGITGRFSENFGSKLSTSYPKGLFCVLLKLEVVTAHLKKTQFCDEMVLSKTNEMVKFCRALSNIYQVCLQYLFISKELFHFFLSINLIFTSKKKPFLCPNCLFVQNVICPWCHL